MDPNYLKYISSVGIDPSKYIEMQANYLRLLANCYNTNPKTTSSENPQTAKIYSESLTPKQENLIKGENSFTNQEKSYTKEEKSFAKDEKTIIKEENILTTGEKVSPAEIINNEEDPKSKFELNKTKKPICNHDEIPIKSLSMPFEKLLEEEIKKNSEPEPGLSESKSKHTFLKRKSQNIKPKKETKDKKEEQKSEKTEDYEIMSLEDTGKIESTHDYENEKLDIKDNSYEQTPADIKKIQQNRHTPSFDHLQSTTESPKSKQTFLKRGKGKLCIKPRSSTSVGPKKQAHKHILSKDSDSQDNENSEECLSDTEIKPVPLKNIKENNKDFLRYRKLAKELENKKAKLEKDALDFYKMRESEVKSLELWKSEEIKKLSEEIKKLSNEKKTIEKLNNKIQNENLDNEKLKKEIINLKNTLIKNEEKYIKTIESLKDIIEDLSNKNKELEKLLSEKKSISDRSNIEENALNRIMQSSSQQKKSSIIKSASCKFHKEETPKFKKVEIFKDLPSFSFKLPDKKIIESKMVGMKKNIVTPVIEIKLEETKTPGVQEIIEENKVQRIYEDGKREISFSNGVKKEIFPDGYIVVHFNNKDKKESFPDGKIVYHFFENKTVQTTFPDGLQLFQFANGQTEKHYTDGTKEIAFPDKTIKCIFNDGEEESIFPDGTIQKIEPGGIRHIEFVNGMKDTIYPDGSKIRKYPDGKIKKTAPDGKVIE
ncbi:hypothetical protein SteCoe_79 [Stentor coeruleus]|uniref:Centromere protein J C-terminal domain-containing protein n=1 Tax=Stentor coeruleus TaxID=5963 RepID=A0A1R2D554_9CILI|nr:hypothetical protein SteCoe_79 [Stentor coeruleus]